MQILMTGATGYLGALIYKEATSKGHAVDIITRDVQAARSSLAIHQATKVIELDWGMIRQAFKHRTYDLILHLATQYEYGDTTCKQINDANVKFPAALLDLAIKQKVPYFLNTDTFFNVNDRPPIYKKKYVNSKKYFFEILQKNSRNIHALTAKLHHVYGPNEAESKFFGWLLATFQKQTEIDLSPGHQTRDFVFVNDVVGAYLSIISNISMFESGQVLDIGSGRTESLKSFVKKIANAYEALYGKKIGLNFGAKNYKFGELMDVKSDLGWANDLTWQPSTTTTQGALALVSASNEE